MAFPSDLVRTKNWGTEILTDSDLEGQYDLIINWVMAALNASTGHSHDGTSNQGPQLTISGVSTGFVNGATTVTGASGDYLLIADVSDSNKNKKCLASDYTFVPSASNALSGSTLQTQVGQTTSLVTCSTAMFLDDTIPQNTEGNEVTTVAIQPSNSSNTLVITVTAPFAHSGSGFLIGAIYQDSTANAIAAGTASLATSGETGLFTLQYKMTAGTTSSTTFKLRMGTTSGTVYVNGVPAGTRAFGGVSTASIKVEEIKA